MKLIDKQHREIVFLKVDRIRSGVIGFATSCKFRSYPWREKQRSPYEILIAEVTLKRTTATAASRMYEGFLSKFGNIYALNRAAEDEIAASLARIGLHNQRAKALKNLAAHLVEHSAGKVPLGLSELLEVPGIGDYTARAVQSFGHGIPAAIVDSNVERIIRRVFLESFGTSLGSRQLQEVADMILPQEQHRSYNFGLLDIGALVCKPLRPDCSNCPLISVCDYAQESTAERSGC